jgi:hypothetical protein
MRQRVTTRERTAPRLETAGPVPRVSLGQSPLMQID